MQAALAWHELRVFARRASQAALRGFLRLTPSEKNRIFSPSRTGSCT